MIVITLTDVPNRLRGDLSKWLLEIDVGVFVGNPNARVRDELWERVLSMVKNGRATLTYSTNNEQRFSFRVHNSKFEVADFDGLQLILRPKPQRSTDGEIDNTKLKLGFSKASQRRKSKKFQTRFV
jgi:CRISPR-associated protein Cas2